MLTQSPILYQVCVERCASLGYRFAGTQYGEEVRERWTREAERRTARLPLLRSAVHMLIQITLRRYICRGSSHELGRKGL